MSGKKGRAGRKKKVWAAYPCFQLRYKLDQYFYFVHAKTRSNARWQVIRRHKKAYGFTGMLTHWFPQLDNVPITREKLLELGFIQARGDKDAVICACALCTGGRNAEEAGKNN